jgi:hypothetical protein
MTQIIAPLLLITLAAEPPAGPPRESPSEHGHGLTAKESAEGWISLFDGQSTFGWIDAKVKDGILTGGTTTTRFAAFELRAEVTQQGELKVGDQRLKAIRSTFTRQVRSKIAAPIELVEGLAVGKLAIRPLDLENKLNGKDMTGWTTLHHPRIAEDKRPKWSVSDGVVRAVGGPGAIELQERFADFVLQIEARTAKMANGGVFVRADPGSFMNGYEAQVYNGCYDGDPAKPCRYSTGAIDDRQLARRLVSRDREWFTMTVVANGPHLATWVNGYQMTDWTDTRPKDSNPRKGLRLEAGTIQLQAHDPETDVEFRNVRIVEIPSAK